MFCIEMWKVMELAYYLLVETIVYVASLGLSLTSRNAREVFVLNYEN